MRGWGYFVLRAVFAAVVGAAFGTAIGNLWFGVALAVAAWGGWHSYYLHRLTRWLEKDIEPGVPRGVGIWGDVFYKIGRMRAQSRERRRNLKELLVQYRRSIDALPDAAIILDKYNRIQFFNSTAKTMLGLRQPDIGLFATNLLRHPQFVSLLKQADYSEPLRIPSPLHPEVLLELRIIEYGQEQRLMTVRDISDSERVEQARRDFIASASHEVRTPLTVIVGYLEAMASEADQPPMVDWKEPITHMQGQADRIESILKDLLVLAKLEHDAAGRRQSRQVNVAELIHTAAADVQQLSSGHKIELDVDADLQLMGDKNDIQSLITNLAANAVRHTPEGTVVKIRWGVNLDQAVLEVSDNGQGIAREHHARLTERFYRVDGSRGRSNGGGTGLGMAIVDRVVSHHDGELDVESRVGSGTTFRCRFPASRWAGSVTEPS